MTQEHPITPPPELVQQWDNDWHRSKIKYDSLSTFVATQAARWGADMELEACCLWLRCNDPYEHDYHQMLRVVRRPKPPSLKEQALECLKNIDDACESEGFSRSDDTDIIRRALESLPD